MGIPMHAFVQPVPQICGTLTHQRSSCHNSKYAIHIWSYVYKTNKTNKIKKFFPVWAGPNRKSNKKRRPKANVGAKLAKTAKAQRLNNR